MVSSLFYLSPLPNSNLQFCKTPYIPFHPSHISPILTRKFSWHGFGSRRHHSGLFNTNLRWQASAASWPCYLSDDDFDVELGRLLTLLPEQMRRRMSEHPELHHLIEVVMDLGRKPLARFPSGDFILSDHPITFEDLEQAISQVGDFAVDNRAGISRTLHRISAIRNRKGTIIGLTCRVGRALSGSAHLLRDLIMDGTSLLLIGPPGVGKTTIIRDIARMLADDYKKRVMIVDTSNEIGGDGDIPHTGIGSARRMQVPHSDVQHKVLIEAVENHMPQVIVIDEIGNKLEALAASTIAQRGIQLVATAHGVSLENLVMNPSLEMLVGGVESVTLGDEEASRRGVQKTVLERKGPSTFNSAVEIISKKELHVHRSVEATVDAILSGRYPRFEIRKLDQDTEVEVQENSLNQDSLDTINGGMIQNGMLTNNDVVLESKTSMNLNPINEEKSCEDGDALSIFLYGISEASVIQGIKQLKVENQFVFTDNISEANALLALQSRLKKNSRIQAAARSHGIPVYVTKASSLAHLTKVIQTLLTDYDGVEFFDYEVKVNDAEKKDALEEARVAIEGIVIPEGEPVELLPRPPNILLLQKDLICKYRLSFERIGIEPHVRLRIIPFRTSDLENDDINEMAHSDYDDEDFTKSNGSEKNGPAYMLERLPLLED